MAHYIFHLGPDPLADPPYLVVALDAEGGVVERRGHDLAMLVAECLARSDVSDWRAFAPLVRSLGLPPERAAPPSDAQAMVMADRALGLADLGKYWDVGDIELQYTILRFFATLARSEYFSVGGRGWPYRCRFEGTLNGELFAVASSDETGRSIMVVNAAEDVRRAFEAALNPDGPALPDRFTLLLERETPWWLDFTEALFGVPFEPVVWNVVDGEIYHFNGQTGIVLGAIAVALAAAEPGGEAAAEVAVGDHAFTCTLTRFAP